MGLELKIAQALGAQPTHLTPLSGGCVGEVYRVDLEDGRTVAAKVDAAQSPRLDVEGYMLRYLAEHSKLPVPEVHHSTPSLLIMSWIPGDSRFEPSAQQHAGELLAELHGVKGAAFGLERDTLIGGLHQPNGWMDSWVDFFRERRLLEMARLAREAGTLPAETHRRLESLAEKLGELLEEPPHPSLLHGDVWTTNVLTHGNRISGFIDPAVYYGHPEAELAFIKLFDTFGKYFFSRYNEVRLIAEGFEQRADLYNLYPLLVHVRLFGAGYLSGVDRCLARFGF